MRKHYTNASEWSLYSMEQSCTCVVTSLLISEPWPPSTRCTKTCHEIHQQKALMRVNMTDLLTLNEWVYKIMTLWNSLKFPVFPYRMERVPHIHHVCEHIQDGYTWSQICEYLSNSWAFVVLPLYTIPVDSNWNKIGLKCTLSGLIQGI